MHTAIGYASHNCFYNDPLTGGFFDLILLDKENVFSTLRGNVGE